MRCFFNKSSKLIIWSYQLRRTGALGPQRRYGYPSGAGVDITGKEPSRTSPFFAELNSLILALFTMHLRPVASFLGVFDPI